MVVMAVAAAVSGAASALQQYLGWNYYVSIVIVGAIILCLTNIIKYGYGYCGYLAIAIVVVPFLTVGVYKNRKA